MLRWKLNLRLFGDGGDGAAASDGTGDGGNAAVMPGALDDGTQVDDRLAARLNEQRKRHPERAQVAPAAQQTGTEPKQEPSADDEWAELKKGRFAEQYGRDVQAAIQDRFKNQQDANQTLANLKPMLDALAKKNGIEAGDLKALSNKILDDDSLYEEEAEEHGMTVEAYKQFKALKDESDAARRREAFQRQQQEFDRHIAGLARQGEVLKQKFPQFDLKTEMQNPDFRRLTAPNSGLNVEQAYVALHHDELISGAMSYGIRRTQTQIASTLAANRARPSEGAMQTTAAADITVDPRNMTRAQREELKRQARMGKMVVF